MEEMIKTTKLCAKCGKEKPLSEFYRCRTSTDGLYYYCKGCAKSLQTEKRGKIAAVYHAELDEFMPRTLLEHLAYLGYKGSLELTKTIEVRL